MNEMESIKKFERCQELAQDLGFYVEVLSNCFEIESHGRFDSVGSLHSFLCGFEQGRSYGRMESVLRQYADEIMTKLEEVSFPEEIWNHQIGEHEETGRFLIYLGDARSIIGLAKKGSKND